MSPILVRPVREQLEHDRVIRLLQAKYKRKFEVGINPGNEQAVPVGGPPPWYPDLVLQSAEKSRKLLGVVEVETTESVNQLEAMSQWASFSRFRVPFHLYVPIGCIDSARRLCSELQIPAAEVWAYSAVGDQMRFTLVQRSAQTGDGKAAKRKAAEPAARRKTAAVKSKSKPAPRRAAASRGRSGRPAPPAKGAKKTARKPAARSSRPQKRR